MAGHDEIQCASRGAELTLNASDPDADVVGQIKDHTGGLGAHVSFEAAGSPITRRQAIQCLRAWGKSCYVGEGGEVSLDVSAELLRKQITLMGSWTFSIASQAECADYVANKKIDVDRLFTHRWQLNDAEQAYQLFDQQAAGKGVFLFD